MRTLLYLCQLVFVLSASRQDFLSHLEPLVVPCVESCNARQQALWTLQAITPIPAHELELVNSNPQLRSSIEDRVICNLYILGVTGDEARRAAGLLLDNPEYYVEMENDVTRVIIEEGLMLPIPYRPSQLPVVAPQGMELYPHNPRHLMYSIIVLQMAAAALSLSLLKQFTTLDTDSSTLTSTFIAEAIFKLFALIACSSTTLNRLELYEQCTEQDHTEMLNSLESFSPRSTPPVCIAAELLPPNVNADSPFEPLAYPVGYSSPPPVSLGLSESKLYNPDDLYNEHAIFVSQDSDET